MDVSALWHAGLDGAAPIATTLGLAAIAWLLRRVGQGNNTAAQAQLIALAQNIGSAAYRQLSAYGDAHLKNVTSHNAMIDYCIQEAQDVVLPALTAAGVTPESFRTLVLGGLGHALAADPNVVLPPLPGAVQKPLAFEVDSVKQAIPVAGVGDTVTKAAASAIVLLCLALGLSACAGALTPSLTAAGVAPGTAQQIDASAAQAGQLMCLLGTTWLAADGANVKNATKEAVAFTCDEIAKGSTPGAPPAGSTAAVVSVAADVLARLEASKTH